MEHRENTVCKTEETNKQTAPQRTEVYLYSISLFANKEEPLDCVLTATIAGHSIWSKKADDVWSTTAWKWIACAIKYLMAITNK